MFWRRVTHDTIAAYWFKRYSVSLFAFLTFFRFGRETGVGVPRHIPLCSIGINNTPRSTRV